MVYRTRIKDTAVLRADIRDRLQRGESLNTTCCKALNIPAPDNNSITRTLSERDRCGSTLSIADLVFIDTGNPFAQVVLPAPFAGLTCCQLRAVAMNADRAGKTGPGERHNVIPLAL